MKQLVTNRLALIGIAVIIFLGAFAVREITVLGNEVTARLAAVDAHLQALEELSRNQETLMQEAESVVLNTDEVSVTVTTPRNSGETATAWMARHKAACVAAENS